MRLTGLSRYDCTLLDYWRRVARGRTAVCRGPRRSAAAATSPVRPAPGRSARPREHH